MSLFSFFAGICDSCVNGDCNNGTCDCDEGWYGDECNLGTLFSFKNVIINRCYNSVCVLVFVHSCDEKNKLKILNVNLLKNLGLVYYNIVVIRCCFESGLEVVFWRGVFYRLEHKTTVCKVRGSAQMFT